MNKRLSTVLSLALLATTLGWQQPLVNAQAATHAKTTQTTKRAKTTNKAKHIKLQGKYATNFRDLGGMVNKNGQKIKAHRLLRANKLYQLTNSDVKKLVNTYHLKTDIDLRTLPEQKQQPDRKIKGVKFINNPMFNGFGKRPDFKIKGIAKKTIEGSYRKAITSAQGRRSFKVLFKALLNNPANKAVLWHCSAGKDRAGMATAIVLSALNFDKKTIMNDYLMSNQYLSADINQAYKDGVKAGHTKNELANNAVQQGVRKYLLNATFSAINDKYGSMQNFLHKGLGLTNSQLAQLQKNYLTAPKTK